MPHTEMHKTKRKKNYTILAILVAFMAMIWAITMIKMGLQ
jgi:hypothetical protein